MSVGAGGTKVRERIAVPTAKIQNPLNFQTVFYNGSCKRVRRGLPAPFGGNMLS
jgi:hypothetical protein